MQCQGVYTIDVGRGNGPQPHPSEGGHHDHHDHQRYPGNVRPEPLARRDHHPHAHALHQGDWINGDYIEFDGLTGDAAAQLARLLTPPARQDRQNNAPTILTLLRIAATTPGVTLSGYIIRAPRRDERVTVDAISAPEHLFAPDPAGNDDEALLPIEWSTFCRVLGISDEVIPLDEFQSYRNADREVMWRAWWD